MKKKIEKEFYVNNWDIKKIKSKPDALIHVVTSDEFKTSCENKITISWEEPEKKVEITESEFDKLFNSAINELDYNSIGFEAILKKTIFGE